MQIVQRKMERFNIRKRDKIKNKEIQKLTNNRDVGYIIKKREI